MIRRAAHFLTLLFQRQAASAAVVSPENSVCSVESDSVLVEDVGGGGTNFAAVEGLGIETQGGVFTPLIPMGSAVPCSITETFTTAANRQTELFLRLYRGNHKIARLNHFLGSYRITGIPSARAGASLIEVTFRVSEEKQIVVAAQSSRKPLSIHRSHDAA